MNRIDPSDLWVLHSINYHANALLLANAASLNEDQFSGPSSPRHGSVRGMLTHV